MLQNQTPPHTFAPIAQLLDHLSKCCMTSLATRQTWSRFSLTTVPDNNRRSGLSPMTVPKLSTGHLVNKIIKIFERWSISWAVEGNVQGESDFLWFLKHKCLAYSRYSVILYILLLLFPTVLLSFCPFARFVHLFILSTCPFCPLVRSVHLSIMSTCSFCSLVQSVLIHKTEMTRKINK